MIHTDILQYAVQHPNQVVAAVVALAGVAAHYRKTGNLPLGRLPWRAARSVVRDLRERYFGRPRPRGVPGVVVDTSPGTLEDALRNHHFEGVPLSYDYTGADLTLRRPSGTMPNPETGEPVAMELHPRGFETADGRTWVIAHDEASRYEATDEHLEGDLLSWQRGQGMLATTLANELDFQYAKAPSERDADVEVVS